MPKITLKPLKTMLIPLLLTLSGIALVLGIINFSFVLAKSLQSRDSASITKGSWQAVFLANSQVYFGHLSRVSSQSPVLKNVYYVQVIDSNTNSTTPSNTAPTKGRLIRLGDVEPHGPENEMILNKNQILFWENLRPDSYVVNSINNLEKAKK